MSISRYDVVNMVINSNNSENAIGVEVGVKRGELSKQILSAFKGKLYMVDSWRYFYTGYNDIANVNNTTQDQFMYEALQVAKEHDPRAIIVRDLSVNASNLFNDNSLDFVYIDAAHDYVNVTNDLKAWFPKVKVGGFIFGDDYLEGIHFDSEFGVIKATHDFFKDKNICFETSIDRTKEIPQWWAVKL